MPREHPLAPHRLLPIAVIALLGVVALLALRGPAWFQRLYHPLRYETLIAARARSVSLDPYLVAAVINVESGFEAADVSGRGAVGLMQVMPDTAAEVARGNGLRQPRAEALKDPDTNIHIGTLHLSGLAKRFGSIEEALAAYNAGESNVRKWIERGKGLPEGSSFLDAIDFPETRQYVIDVLAQRDQYRKLYPDAFREASK